MSRFEQMIISASDLVGEPRERELARAVVALTHQSAAAGPFHGGFARFPAPHIRAPRLPPTARSPRVSAWIARHETKKSVARHRRTSDEICTPRCRTGTDLRRLSGAAIVRMGLTLHAPGALRRRIRQKPSHTAKKGARSEGRRSGCSSKVKPIRTIGPQHVWIEAPHRFL